MNQNNRRYEGSRESQYERGYGEGYGISRAAQNEGRDWTRDDDRDDMEGRGRRAGGHRGQDYGERTWRSQTGGRGVGESDQGYGRGFDETEFYSGAGADYSRAPFREDDYRGGQEFGGGYGYGRSGSARAQGDVFGGAYGDYGRDDEWNRRGYSQGRQGYGRHPDQNLGQGSYGQPGLGQGGYGRNREEPRGYEQGAQGGRQGRRGQEEYAGFGDYTQRAYQAQGELGRYRGRGPRDYRRSDERITEDLNERLTEDSLLDASDISVRVSDGVATLQGTVESRWMKHRAEDIADACSGIKDVRNEIRVNASGAGGGTSAWDDAASTGGTDETGDANATTRARGKSSGAGAAPGGAGTAH